MDLAEVEARLEHHRLKVEEALETWIPRSDADPTTLHAAMRHSLEAGGKRLRPVLVCGVSESFPGPGDPLPAAVAIECLHTYTLIHDDLPCMDDGELRRGRPTCHKAFGEAAAVLAGDGLLTLAFGILAHGYESDPSLATALVADLAEAGGSAWLVGGQMEDIENDARPMDASALAAINAKKTGALIAAACRFGARIGNARLEEIDLLGRFGFALGGAFQVVDDLLDANGKDTEIGKTANRDAANGKTTYVTLEGEAAARERARSLTEEAESLLAGLDRDTAFLRGLTGRLLDRAR